MIYFSEINIFILAAFIVAIAGLIRGFTGFGNMIVMSPGLSLIFGPVVAIPMIYIIELPIVSFFLLKFFSNNKPTVCASRAYFIKKFKC